MKCDICDEPSHHIKLIVMSLDRHVKPTLCPTDVSAHPQWFAQVSMQMYSAKDVYKCHV